MRLSVVSLLSLASTFVTASPVIASRDNVAITDTIFANSHFYIQYAAAAYCNSDAAAGAKVECSEGCPNVVANGAVVIGSVPNSTFFDMEGFVAVDSVRKEVVLSFRGSSSVRNWIADLYFIQTSCDWVDDCLVHSGFLDSWNEIKAVIYGFIETAFAANPTYTLVVTGHSLGGAVGTLAVADLREDGYPCDLYTYGSPRVGNMAFVEFVTTQAGNEYRTTHYDDPVPRLPPIFLNYRHTSNEYWLADGPATDIDYTLTEVETCVGYANTSCNAGTFGLDGDAHEYYLQYVGCGDDDNGITFKKRDEPKGLRSRDDVSDEELEERLNNYTATDVTYAAGINSKRSALLV